MDNRLYKGQHWLWHDATCGVRNAEVVVFCDLLNEDDQQLSRASNRYPCLVNEVRGVKISHEYALLTTVGVSISRRGRKSRHWGVDNECTMCRERYVDLFGLEFWLILLEKRSIWKNWSKSGKRIDISDAFCGTSAAVVPTDAVEDYANIIFSAHVVDDDVYSSKYGEGVNEWKLHQISADGICRSRLNQSLSMMSRSKPTHPLCE